MKSTTSNDLRNFSGIERELFELHMSTMKDKLKIDLLYSLLNQKLATKDIFHFSRGQAERRQFKKFPDWATMQSAMVAKLSDVKMALKNGYILRSKKRLQLFKTLGVKRKAIKCIRRIRAQVQKEKTKIWDKVGTVMRW